jgi:hypothetical protein
VPVALLVAAHRLVLPAVLALPAVPIFVAGRAAARAEALSREYAEQLVRYRHLFVVADRFRRQADGGGVNGVQLAAAARELRASTSMLEGLLGTIAGEAERLDLPLLRDLAGNASSTPGRSAASSSSSNALARRPGRARRVSSSTRPT